MQKNIYFHAHIGKSAGTTFNSVLQNNFQDAFLMEYPMLYDIIFPSNHMKAYVELYNYRCISSHNFRWDQIPFRQYPFMHCFTFVREPVRRLMSNFFYQRTRKDVREDYPVKTMPMDTLVERVLDGEISVSYTLNSQLEMMVQDGELETVKELAATGNFQLFQTERFNETCVLLEHLYPQDLADCSFPAIVNRTPSYRKDDEALKAQIAKLPFVETDRKLHVFAGEVMDKCIEDLFENRNAFQSACDDFQERCVKKSHTLKYKIGELKKGVMKNARKLWKSTMK